MLAVLEDLILSEGALRNVAKDVAMNYFQPTTQRALHIMCGKAGGLGSVMFLLSLYVDCSFLKSKHYKEMLM